MIKMEVDRRRRLGDTQYERARAVPNKRQRRKKKFREPQPIGVCKFVVWRQGHSEQTWYVGSDRKPRPQ
jgi:hypothetical protein